MNHAISRFSLDVHSEVSQIQLDVRRWETARSLYINLTENGMPYEIAEGCTATIAIEKPDGSILKNNCQIIENEIRYDFTSRTTVSVGMLDCEIRLLDNSGNLLTSPRFSILVHSTIYDNGDAVEQEIVNANTVKSANPGYAEVFMWSDGNPTGEDRVGYFVTADMERSAAMVKKADTESEVWGVSMAAPGFASNGGSTRYDDQSNLISNYCYVGLMGFAPVIDNGTCTVNGRCSPGADGSAVPDTTGNGYLVVERLDDTHVLILLEASSSAKKYVQNYMQGFASKDYAEQKKLAFYDTAVPEYAFISDTTYPDYPFRAAVALTGVTTGMIPEVVFSLTDAVSGNFAPVAAAYNGGVYIYAAEKPAATITIPTIICWREV